MDATDWTAIGAVVAGILAAVAAFAVKVLPRVTEALTARAARWREEKDANSKRDQGEQDADAKRTRNGFQPTIDVMQAHIARQEARINALENERNEANDRREAERGVWAGKIQELVDANTECERRVAKLSARVENLEQINRSHRRGGPTK